VVFYSTACEPKDGDIAVCFIDGEFTVKRLSVRDVLFRGGYAYKKAGVIVSELSPEDSFALC